MNSILLKGDVRQAVADLKQRLEKDLVILGSGTLVQSLMKENLIDRYMFLIHPLVLGEGKRLFDKGISFTSLKLVNTETNSKGVIITIYEPVESASRVG
jgi:dihydrofolate reductase